MFKFLLFNFLICWPSWICWRSKLPELIHRRTSLDVLAPSGFPCCRKM